MAWLPSQPATTTTMSASPSVFQGNNGSIQSVLTNTNLSTGIPYIPNTHAVYFYANTAPSGWTLENTVTDCLLAIKGGTSQYNNTGGQVVGTWNGPSYALLGNQIPNQGVVGSGNSVQFFIGPSFGSDTHSHDWTTTRPMAALGILCTKNS